MAATVSVPGNPVHRIFALRLGLRRPSLNLRTANCSKIATFTIFGEKVAFLTFFEEICRLRVVHKRIYERHNRVYVALKRFLVAHHRLEVALGRIHVVHQRHHVTPEGG